MVKYWDKSIETMPQEKIKALQLELFNKQLQRAGCTTAYRGKLPSQIDDLTDICHIPFTQKEDLRQSFPYGFLAVTEDKIARFNASSGTTGIPTLAYFTDNDLKDINSRVARCFFAAGLRENMKIQCMTGYGLFVAGWLGYFAARSIGAAIVPTGSGNTQRQIYFMQSLRPEFLFSTVGYLQHVMAHQQFADEDFIKGAIVGGEPCPQSFKNFLLSKYKIDLYENYGSTELGGSVAGDCSYHLGLHVAEDHFYIEIINPETGEVLPDGEYGELVVTPLKQEAFPLIRYRTRDITRILPGTCPCGRTHRRIEPISRRIDDMLLINGVNVFPSQIEECIYRHLTMATNYLIHVREREGLKKLFIDIEVSDDLLQDNSKLQKLEINLHKTLKSLITVSAELNFVPIGTLPETDGKAKRVVRD